MSGDTANTVPIREFSLNDRNKVVWNEFAAYFNKNPDFCVRVPGRVNLIGEHIDYCGYGVCPMALEQDVFLAVGVDDGCNTLRLHNVDTQFKDYECEMKDIQITTGNGAPEWHQYFLCGIKGIFDILPEAQQRLGMSVVVSGRVPQSAGLSSSSALVSAAALATAHAHNFPMSKEKIANLCAECERYIGTQGGGMDQAIAFLATEGCAKHIEFSPLRSSDITLPSGAVFVIAHSLAELNKAATADYNCRVVECRLAAQIIAKKNGIDWTSVRKLGDVQQLLSVDLSTMIAIVQQTLHEEVYSKQEVVEELETSNDYLNGASLTPNTRHINEFKLRQRALHVFQEAHRVEMFHTICSQAPSDPNTLSRLGQLMKQSHVSLRDLYECSHPRLDRLMELSGELALGARLTGAGWGGCAVALVRPENVDKYMEMLKRDFYRKEIGEEVLFATSPQSGACIYSVSK